MPSTDQEKVARTSLAVRSVRFLLFVYGLFILAILLSPISVWLEMASHFVWQGILGGLCLLIIAFWIRQWRVLALTFIAWCYLIVLFQPWNLWLGKPTSSSPAIQNPKPQGASPGDTPANRKLKVMSWNVLCLNENLEEMHRVIESNPVDILVLIEIRPNLVEQLPLLSKMYPEQFSFPSWGGNGIAVMTDRRDIQFNRVDFGGKIMPSIEARVANEVSIVGVHTWSPYPPSRARARDVQLRELTDWLAKQERPVCVVGDLNITPWAPAFRKMIQSGLVDSRASGFGNSASWPSWLGPLGIPIDHALTHGPCVISNRKLGPIVRGSDHRPVLIEVEY